MSVPHPRQAERTSLSWQRTALGVVGVAALLAHVGGTATWIVPLLLGVTLLVVAEDRLRRISAGISRDAVPPARATALGLTATVLLLSVLGAAAVLRG